MKGIRAFPGSAGLSLLVAAAMLCVVSPAGAVVTVPAGFDLLQTQPGTSFAAVPFLGVPLGTYDFGGSLGVKNVGTTDTIVQRLSPATLDPPASQTIPIEMVALQLESTVPVDFGLGVGFYFITLQSARGGPATTGQMTLQDTGTFSSFFDVFFDIRLGGLDGPIALSGDETLTATDVPWTNSDPPGHIPGVNDDFSPGPTFTESGQNAIHVVSQAQVPVPEPVTASLTTGALAALVLWLTRRRGPASSR